MNEFNSALGLLQLKFIDQVLQRRKEIAAYYREALTGVEGISLLSEAAQTESNASYFTVFIESNYHMSRDSLYEKLKNSGVNARRYF